MSKFIRNLGKGFVRSTVNQVGRDTGRVISNTIYGDLHATPIRRVYSNNKNSYYSDTGQPISDNELRNIMLEEGYNPVFFKYGIQFKVFLFLLGCIYVSMFYFASIFIAIIPVLWILYIGIKRIFSNKIRYCKYENIPQYVPDRRYKTGTRFAGYSREKIVFKIIANEQQQQKLKKIGFIYICLSGLMALISIPIILILEKYAN